MPNVIPVNTFTVYLNNTTAFKIPGSTGVTKVTFQYVSGTVTIRGNMATLPTTDTSDIASSLSDSVITMTTTISTLTLTANGIAPLAITVDASAGVCAMVVEIGG